jgi:hypothetical protein
MCDDDERTASLMAPPAAARHGLRDLRRPSSSVPDQPVDAAP